ncbi:MAG: tripartite tricarboxylate transporter permease, partial [Spirochaetota bacterium]
YSDVVLMLIFGVVGFFLKQFDIKPAPIVLGLILGPMFESNMRSALEISRIGVWTFFDSTICIVLVILILFAMFYPVIRKLVWKKKAQKADSSKEDTKR